MWVRVGQCSLLHQEVGRKKGGLSDVLVKFVAVLLLVNKVRFEEKSVHLDIFTQHKHNIKL